MRGIVEARVSHRSKSFEPLESVPSFFVEDLQEDVCVDVPLVFEVYGESDKIC